MFKVLVIDDESSICTALSFALEDNYEVFTAKDEKTALAIINEVNINIILLDLRIGDENGLEVLKKIKFVNKEIMVIMMTAFGTIESSVEAIKNGAFYYITKPINMEELSLLMKKAEEYIGLNSKIKYLSDKVEKNYNIIGSSSKMKEVFNLIDRVKDVNINVFITGESGTGKELVARAIHFNAKRKDKAFNVINCSAIPDNLLESELFGYKKGAFTGATEDRKGIIELSNEGTLFLDEIGDMDINLQTKLLRVIQDREIRPVGSNKIIKVDVRFISATNKNLKEEVKRGNFRQDLFYRLNVINIELPPLRERMEDIPEIIEYFIKKYSNQFEKAIKGITAGALQALERYKFNGNVRELQNILERAVVLTRDEYIDKEDLPPEIFERENILLLKDHLIPIYVGEDMKTIEKKVIEYNLKKFKQNRKNTAEALGISERNLRYKIKEYGL
ncbi:sigma-54-dependent transcriptional regulator [Clostridium peptidivorans]|uniref:sigma-54-dependent transcriptional regulator n=1 Tax=Clostridium peptidivorans TaxID=100174 RepID=UPI000BE3C427|nr:sigma-54 dependent transcriptional regulator [Clostridium peptidivorans]